MVIVRNGHRLRDMGLGTFRHEDDQLPCRRPRMISADDRAWFCWDRKERRAVWENICSQAQVDFDAECVQLSLSPRGFASIAKYEEKKRAGFVVDSP